MRILKQDAEAQLLSLRPDTIDDLWHLSHVVEKGDVATATTWREPAFASAKANAKVEKRAMTLGVRVEDIEFHEFSNRLRISGPIVEGEQDHGMYHTLNIEPLTEITLVKPRGWRDHQLQRVKESVDETRRPLVTFLSIEENEAVIAVLRAYGVQKMAEVIGHQSGKRYASGGATEQDFFDEVLMALRDYRKEDSPLLVVGPGFAKDRFIAYAKTKDGALVKGAIAEGIGQAGLAGVQEALRRGIVERVAKEQRVSQETLAVEDVLEAVGKGEPATYGEDAVRRAIGLGAAQVVLVTDNFLREKGDDVLALAKTTGAKTVVVSAFHEAGRKLSALGGIAARLRYAVDGL